MYYILEVPKIPILNCVVLSTYKDKDLLSRGNMDMLKAA